MSFYKINTLKEYLNIIEKNNEEKNNFISSLTIHTTSWFREMPHYELLLKKINEFYQESPKKTFKIWSTAVSTGEELWSAGLVLEYFRSLHPEFQYELYGSDIDPISLEIAQRAVYLKANAHAIPQEYQKGILVGTEKLNAYITLESEIRKKAHFFVSSLVQESNELLQKKFDWIFCRNVLIYFETKTVVQIVNQLSQKLNADGVLCLGHSEALDVPPLQTNSISNSCYSKNIHKKMKIEISEKSSVLVIDDSTVVRKVIKALVEKDHRTVYEAESAERASELVRMKKFDLITLDLSMPGKDGLTWLKEFRKNGDSTPVIIISDSDPKEAEKTFGALESGAQDYIIKSVLNQNPEDVSDRISALIQASFLKSEPKEKKVSILNEGVSYLNSSELLKEIQKLKPEVILIGASTGGPDALWKTLKSIPHKNLPPIVVVQHINANFAKPFADRLSLISEVPLLPPLHNQVLTNGSLVLAWDSTHIGIEKKKDHIVLKVSESEKLNGHRPAVDFLFSSAAQSKIRALSILMTGLGRDGALGMKDLWNARCSVNIAQNENSCVVYGMPKEAVKLGAVHSTLSLEEIRELIIEFENSKLLKVV